MNEALAGVSSRRNLLFLNIFVISIVLLLMSPGIFSPKLLKVFFHMSLDYFYQHKLEAKNDLKYTFIYTILQVPPNIITATFNEPLYTSANIFHGK